MNKLNTISSDIIAGKRRAEIKDIINFLNKDEIQQFRLMYGFNQEKKSLEAIIDDIHENYLEGIMSHVRRSILKDIHDL